MNEKISADNITVVIPTKNEEKNIVTFLASLPESVKLIIVDSSTDNTREIIMENRPVNTQVIHKDCTIPVARQLGGEAAKTDWILYSDADMIFDDEYFDKLAELKVRSLTGALFGPKLSKKDYKLYYWHYTINMWFFGILTIPIGSGSNMIIRKKALLDVNGFDAALTHSEDTDILWRVRKGGWKVPFHFGIKVYEMDHRRLQKGVIKKMLHGGIRHFFLVTGIFKNKVRKSDWGYWNE
jgi:glycosyltransferase involved in cell wall biosynthesis